MNKFKKIVLGWFYLPAWQQILVALVAGIAAGVLLNKQAVIFRPIGIIFIHAIQMMIVPVVFTAIVCAVLAIEDSAKMGRIWIKALLIYIISMLVASGLGMGLATWIHPGSGVDLAGFHFAQIVSHPLPSFAEQLINIVPANAVVAFENANILQILVFALILGFAINSAGDPAKPIADLFKSFSVVVFKFAGIIMSFAPYGIFALLAWVLGEFGLAILIPLLKFIGTIYLGCFLLIVVYYFSVLLLMRINPVWFMRNIFSAAVVAFTTSSSAATLPESFNCASNKLHVDKNIAGFLLPLGASLNLNGLSIYISAATIFAANIFNIDLHATQYVTILVSTVLSAMGAAAVPGSAIIVMGAVMGSVGIPLGALPLIAGVDRFNDMAQTATNVIGDLFATMVIAKNEKQSVEDVVEINLL